MTVTVRNMPESLVMKLKACAKESRRIINNEIIVKLE